MSWLDTLSNKSNEEHSIISAPIQGLSKQECLERIAELNSILKEVQAELIMLDEERKFCSDEEVSGVIASYKETKSLLTRLHHTKVACERRMKVLSFSLEDAVRGCLWDHFGETISSHIAPSDITLSSDDISMVTKALATKGINREASSIATVAKGLGYKLADSYVNDYNVSEVGSEGMGNLQANEVDVTDFTAEDLAGDIAWLSKRLFTLEDVKLPEEYYSFYTNSFEPFLTKYNLTDFLFPKELLRVLKEKTDEELNAIKIHFHGLMQEFKNLDIPGLSEKESASYQDLGNIKEAATEEEIKVKVDKYRELQAKLDEFNKKVTELKDAMDIFSVEEDLGKVSQEIFEDMNSLNIMETTIKDVVLKVKERAGFIKAKDSAFMEDMIGLLRKYIPIAAEIKDTLVAAGKEKKQEGKEQKYEQVREKIKETPELQKYVTEVAPVRTLDISKKETSLDSSLDIQADNWFTNVYRWFVSKISPKIEALSQGVDKLNELADKIGM